MPPKILNLVLFLSFSSTFSGIISLKVTCSLSAFFILESKISSKSFIVKSLFWHSFSIPYTVIKQSLSSLLILFKIFSNNTCISSLLSSFLGMYRNENLLRSKSEKIYSVSSTIDDASSKNSSNDFVAVIISIINDFISSAFNVFTSKILDTGCSELIS